MREYRKRQSVGSDDFAGDIYGYRGLEGRYLQHYSGRCERSNKDGYRYRHAYAGNDSMKAAAYRAALTALITSVSLAACGGHGSSPLPRTPQGAQLNFTMHWPAKTSTMSLRRPKYISPSTMSVVVEVNNDASLTTIADNPSNGQPVTSNVVVNAPAGNDTITISLYDKTGGNGNELGQVTVTQQIVSAQVNTLSATIDGIVSSVDFKPLPNQSAVATSTDASGATTYTISGGATATFVATAKDAGGNVIVGPGDPITYTANAVNPALNVAQDSTHPERFTVASGSTRASHPVGVTVHAADGQGGTAQSNYSITLAPMLFVAYLNGGGPAQIAGMTMTGQKLSLPGTFPGATNPIGLVFDEDDRRLFELDGTSHELLAFNSDGTAVAGFTPQTVPAGVGLTYDSNNHELYVASSDNGVSVFQTDGTPVSVPGTWDNNSTPTGIAAWVIPNNGGLEQIYVANAGNNTLARYNEDGTDGPWVPVSHTPFYDVGMPPVAVAADADVNGVMYVDGIDGTGTETLTVLEALPGFPISSITTGLSGAAGILFDSADDFVLVANRTSGTLSVYDGMLGGLVTSIPAPSGLSTPIAIGIAY